MQLSGFAFICGLVGVTLGARISGRFHGDSRIVNGDAVGPSEAPFMASLREVGDTISSHVCGGSVINEEWILTGARCCVDPYRFYHITVGEYDSYNTFNNSEQIRDIRFYTAHERYIPNLFHHDICVIRVADPFDLSTALAKAASLPIAGTEITPGTKLMQIGWGKVTSGFYDPPEYLQGAQVIAVSDADCLASQNGLTIPEQICTSTSGGTVGFCDYDYGGPVIIPGTYEQVGVISWTNGCAAEDHDDVHTQVSKYIDWICTNTLLTVCP